MNETRLLALLVREGLQHGVDMPGEAGAALDRETGGLVEDEDLVVLVKEHGAKRFRIAQLARRLALCRRNAPSGSRSRGPAWPFTATRDRCSVHWRNANRLPRLEACVGFDPAAVDPDLAGTQQLLEMAEGQVGIVRLEPTVEAHPGFVGLDGQRFIASH